MNAPSNRLRHERGAVLVQVTIALFPLLGFLGLALDVGHLYHHRRRMQTAADAGATAGGAEIQRGLYSTNGSTSVLNATAANGFTNGTGGVTVDYHRPPVSGYYAGDDRYVEVVIQQNTPTFIIGMFGYPWMNVPARAVAGVGAEGKACLQVLDPSMEGALRSDSSAILNAPECGIVINSTHSNAMDLNSSTTITAGSVAIAGGYTTESSAYVTPTPKTSVPPATDPLAYLDPPTVGACDSTKKDVWVTSGQNVTLGPGIYCGGMTIEGTVTLNPGLYILVGSNKNEKVDAGSLHLLSSGRITGIGVTFYITSGNGYLYKPVLMDSSTQAQLTAQTSGPYAGILFYNDENAPVCSEGGQGNTCPSNSSLKIIAHMLRSSNVSYFEGALYFPTNSLELHSSSSATAAYSIIVARQVVMQSSANWHIGTDFSSISGGSPIKRLSLVE